MVSTLEVIDVSPAFPVTTSYERRGLVSPIRPGMVQRRQALSSHAKASLQDQVRTFRLRYEMASADERDRMLFLVGLAGNGAALEFLPPDETTAPNLAQQPKDLTGSSWVKETVETGIVDDATSAPSAVGGTAELLTNAGGATAPAALVQGARVFVRSGFRQVLSAYIRRPASLASSRFVLNIREPGANSALVANHSAQFNWNGSAWVASTTTGGATATSTFDASSWWRVECRYDSGDGGSTRPDDQSSTWPIPRQILVQTGTVAAPNAGNGVLVAGVMFEEFVSSASTFSATNTRVPVVNRTDPLQITRTSANHYSWDMELEEVPSAP